MFNIRTIIIQTVFVLLFFGCEDPTKPKETNSTITESTLNDSDLGHEVGYVHDYFLDHRLH